MKRRAVTDLEHGLGQGSDTPEGGSKGKEEYVPMLILMAWIDQGGPFLPTYTLGSIQLFLCFLKHLCLLLVHELDLWKVGHFIKQMLYFICGGA